MEWISVKKCLPKSDAHMVLVVDNSSKHKIMALGHMVVRGKWWIESQVEDVKEMVPTHWMPLPEPPNE